MPYLCIEEIAYCDKMRRLRKKRREVQIIKGALVHLNTSTETEEENLGVCTVENLGPRGPKDKVLKIKSN